MSAIDCTAPAGICRPHDAGLRRLCPVLRVIDLQTPSIVRGRVRFGLKGVVPRNERHDVCGTSHAALVHESRRFSLWTARFTRHEQKPTLPASSINEPSANNLHGNNRRLALRHAVEHAAHLLPSQGPITVFVHHNTLHAFEHLDFDTGVQAGGRLFGCHAYLPEEKYREKLDRGRIRAEDLDAVLQEDLGDEADRLVATFGTRFALRLAMLQFPFHTGTTHELRWIVAETDALRIFRPEVEPAVRDEMLADTRRHVLERSCDAPNENDTLTEVLLQFENGDPVSWNDRTWEAFVLNYLWRVCQEGIRSVGVPPDAPANVKPARRHRDVLWEASGEDADLLVHETLIRFCSAFLDQGFADWKLPNRDAGLFAAFLEHHSIACTAPTRWSSAMRRESRRLQEQNISPLDSIDESLRLLGVDDEELDGFITQTLLALRGWAGMVWQMETNAEWAPQPAPSDSLIEFLAVRLVLDRLAIEQVARDSLGFQGSLDEIREKYRGREVAEPNHFDLRAFTVFQLAQIRGWNPRDLQSLSSEQWTTLVHEIEAFPSLERRRIYHRAFERKYRNETLDAVIAHNVPPSYGGPLHQQEANNTADENNANSLSDVSACGDLLASAPVFQLVTCIDDREESFRRHIEEVCPECETFGVAGFYGTAMYYRGLGQAHFKPLCPVSIKPSHHVVEEPVYSQAALENRRSAARRRIGQLSHQTHLGSRSLFGGMLTAFAGSLAAFPLVGRVLFPRTTARIRLWLGRIIEPPTTQMRIEKMQNEQDDYGFTVDEMTVIVEDVLRSSGLPVRWSPLVIFLGHGSASLNNPHESAYNCGACAGSQGGPNARAFALMANDRRVRAGLHNRGLVIPDTTFFVGGYHDTTNESVTFSDLDRLPISHRARFEEALEVIKKARRRNAQERCRRFESASLAISEDEALQHVEDRPEDLSQARPEYNHATNSLCLVGRRQWSRGLFLDRRAFVTSYDPSLDDGVGTVLEGILRAAVPVCAGINLEYYFSTVDVEGYGCGSKLPHNITSMLGVMSGAASDLRPGLSQQMIEIHEPMRILFVVETAPEVMNRIIENNEAIARLVKGNWVQLAVFDRETTHIHRFVRGEFVLYAPHEREIPTVASSFDWYGGHCEHLGFASIAPLNNSGAKA